jgi:hypothetical protein
MLLKATEAHVSSFAVASAANSAAAVNYRCKIAMKLTGMKLLVSSLLAKIFIKLFTIIL